jgi:hypothetical protein
MTAADSPRPGRRPRLTARAAIRAILGLQVVLALLLLSADFGRVLPALLAPSRAPMPSVPVSPGDQTRRYAPPDRPAIPIPGLDRMPTRLSFDTRDGALHLTGEIAEGDGARFAEHLAGLPAPPARVVLLSPGGSVGDALQIGRAIRDSGAVTAVGVDGFCLSACPYMLAGGTERLVHVGAQVGVHQHYHGQNIALPAFLAVEDIQRGQAEVMDHLDAMGVDPLLMRPAMATPPDEIYILLPEELTGTRLATEIVP